MPAHCTFLALLFRLYARLFALLGVLWGLAPQAAAQASPWESQPVQVWVARAQALQLHGHPQWHRLLHIDAQGRRSDVNSPEFFLAPQGAHDAQAELSTTLAALARPWDGDERRHARCLFPARELWLATQLGLPTAALPDARCAALHKWARLEDIRSISLMQVSGYFGNPASTFGHALLRFNTHSGAATGGLLDLGVNFGAAVPPSEPTLVYVYRGLTGGYQAAFSDRDYYTQDLVYTRTENRDMWNHELALSPLGRSLLVLHLWEISARKFTYYFLSENCAYRLAEVLELAFDWPLRGRSRAWFAPVELFHRLDQASAAQGRAWAQRTVFEPSFERRLLQELAALSTSQRRAFDLALDSHALQLPAALSTLTVEARAPVLNALLAYYQWRIPTDDAPATAEEREARRLILLARLTLPPGAPAPLTVPPMTSPAEGMPPQVWALGVAQRQGRPSHFEFGASAFHYPIGGHHGLHTGALSLLEGQVDWQPGHAPHLAHLNLIQVQKLNTRRAALPGDDPWSWRMRLGWQREGHGSDASSRLRPQLLYTLGLAGQQGPWQGWAMLGASALGSPGAVAANAEAGLIWRRGDSHVMADASVQREQSRNDTRRLVQLAWSQRLSTQHALVVRAQAGSDGRGVGVRWLWAQ